MFVSKITIIKVHCFYRLNYTDDELVVLKMQLANKDSALTDVRLEALTAAQHVDQLKDVLSKLKAL